MSIDGQKKWLHSLAAHGNELEASSCRILVRILAFMLGSGRYGI
jgi:hypothetical protein